jgi:hypothetical protein
MVRIKRVRDKRVAILPERKVIPGTENGVVC